MLWIKERSIEPALWRGYAHGVDLHSVDVRGAQRLAGRARPSCFLGWFDQLRRCAPGRARRPLCHRPSGPEQPLQPHAPARRPNAARSSPGAGMSRVKWRGRATTSEALSAAEPVSDEETSWPASRSLHNTHAFGCGSKIGQDRSQENAQWSTGYSIFYLRGRPLRRRCKPTSSARRPIASLTAPMVTLESVAIRAREC